MKKGRSKTVVQGLLMACGMLCPLFYTSILGLNSQLIYLEDFYKAAFLILSFILIFLTRKASIGALSAYELIVLIIFFFVISLSLMFSLKPNEAIFDVIFYACYYLIFVYIACDLGLAKSIKLLEGFVICQVLFFNAYILIYSTIDDLRKFAMYSPNKSMLGILFGSYCTFLLPKAVKFLSSSKENTARKTIVSIMCIWSILVLLYLNSRASWIGFIICAIVLFYLKTKYKRIKIVFSVLLVLFVGFLAPFFFFLKEGSSYGRILIYKISLNMLKEHWLLGIGVGNFKTQYNLYQSRYFFEQGLEGKYALLADNTYFSFNEILQCFVENGLLVGTGIVIGFFLLLWNTVTLYGKKIELDHFFSPYLAICFLVSTSVLSYTLHSLPIVMLILTLLSYLMCFSTRRTLVINKVRWRKSILIIQAIIACALIVHFMFIGWGKYQGHKAFELSASGYKTTARSIYLKVYNSNLVSGSILYHYAMELYDSNQLLEAMKILSLSMKDYTSNEVFLLLAAIQNELNYKSEAEKNYKLAVYMVPNRMKSRFELMSFYEENRDTLNVIKWGNSILSMGVKIQSSEVASMLKQTRRTLEAFEGRSKIIKHLK
ncbi:MAG: O-antigen ligase family protein [Bacteroidota bacterium]